VYHDRLAFIVYPKHPLAASRKPIDLKRLGRERFIAHNVVSPYRDFTVSTFRHHQVPLNIAVEMPTIESIKHLVARGLGVAFVPRISAQREFDAGTLCEVAIRQFKVERPLRLIAPRRRHLSHAACAFAELAAGRPGEWKYGKALRRLADNVGRSLPGAWHDEASSSASLRDRIDQAGRSCRFGFPRLGLERPGLTGR